MQNQKTRIYQRFIQTMKWTRSSYYLMSAFLFTVFLIAYIWWPLAEEALAYIDWDGPWWLYFDWLLVGIFIAMSVLIMAGADLKVDAWIVFVGLIGGLVIESWGTQTEIWWYYTAERPPMWIIPAWPIASLSIDRLVRIIKLWINSPQSTIKQCNNIDLVTNHRRGTGNTLRWSTILYWLIFPLFFVLMLSFVWPTIDQSLTIMAIFLVGFLIITPTHHQVAVLTFLAGAGLGFFLEYWGTTRECWTYYTLAKPPLFAILAHGMAAVAFWRTSLVLQMFYARICRVKKAAIKEQKPAHQKQMQEN